MTDNMVPTKSFFLNLLGLTNDSVTQWLNKNVIVDLRRVMAFLEADPGSSINLNLVSKCCFRRNCTSTGIGTSHRYRNVRKRPEG